MKYKELFTTGNGLFAQILQPTYPTEYESIFGSQTPESVDTLTLLKHGDKQLLPVIDETTCADIVKAIVAPNIKGWLQGAVAIQTEYDALKPTVKSNTKITENNEHITQTGTDTGSKRCFNDTQFTPDEKDETTSDRTGSVTGSVTETVTGTGTDPVDRLRKEFNFRLTNWRDAIISEIVNELTLHIYV